MEDEIKEDEIKIGTIVEGQIAHITEFGAFVKLSSGEEGLVHISEVANEYVSDITKYVTIGDKVQVKILSRNFKNKLELSIKKAKEPEKQTALFIHKKSKNSVFEEKLTSFLKKSEEKQVDLRRNLKNKQGLNKKRK